VAAGNYNNLVLTGFTAPAAYWEMNDTSGTTLADATGNGHTMTLHGTAGTNYMLNQFPNAGSGLLASQGPTYGCVWFDGLSGYAHAPTFGGLSGLQAFTAIAWVQIDPANTTAANIVTKLSVFGLQITPGVDYLAAQATINGSATSFSKWSLSAAQNPVSSSGSGGAPLGAAPYMLAFAYDGISTKTLSCYINGVLAGTVALSVKTVSNTNSIGIAATGAGAAPFRGYISNVALWPGTTLTLANLQQLYAYGVTPYGATPVVGPTNALVFPWSSIVMSANANAKYRIFTNDSDAVIWLAKGTTATLGQGIALYPRSRPYVMYGYNGAVAAIMGWPIGQKNLCIQEFTQ